MQKFPPADAYRAAMSKWQAKAAGNSKTGAPGDPDSEDDETDPVEKVEATFVAAAVRFLGASGKESAQVAPYGKLASVKALKTEVSAYTKVRLESSRFIYLFFFFFSAVHSKDDSVGDNAVTNLVNKSTFFG